MYTVIKNVKQEEQFLGAKALHCLASFATPGIIK
jgi:hypothetical protein